MILDNIPGAWDDKISSLMVPHWVNICTFNEYAASPNISNSLCGELTIK